ncbi:putative sulfate exporter family transporter [Pollutimonas subterranea]|uniref:Putative sulfate exporter family transporter n=1 Tax=Pollutimonas subterranea TaxID=2045210 RepID=A0A2N4UA10_9BURK|nr:YeiH family protein [Pollutimonas subterranea]PLC51862.1 putative sulfate exporter family transporter [Pollutimonas subterranea]
MRSTTVSRPIRPTHSHSHAASSHASLTGRRSPTLLLGLVLAVVVAIFAMMLGRMFPLIGGPVFAILLGMAIRNTVGIGPMFRPGLQFASRQVLQWSIVALGFGLSIQQVAKTGMESLSVTLVTIAVAFVSAWLLGKWLDIPSKLQTLIGVGTAICGGSAIAAVTPIIKPEEHDTAYAISTIFIFNIVAVVAFPVMGHWLGMSDMGFGMWAGTAINDTSSVVAAGYSYSESAGDYATIVKLTRATLIIPICLILVAIQAWHHKKQGVGSFSLARIFPWFILWFLLASAIRSTGYIPEALLAPLQLTAQFLIVVALAAIGLSSDLRRMVTAGLRPVLLGLGVWLAVCTSSLAVQHVMGSW